MEQNINYEIIVGNPAREIIYKKEEGSND